MRIWQLLAAIVVTAGALTVIVVATVRTFGRPAAIRLIAIVALVVVVAVAVLLAVQS